MIPIRHSSSIASNENDNGRLAASPYERMDAAMREAKNEGCVFQTNSKNRKVRNDHT